MFPNVAISNPAMPKWSKYLIKIYFIVGNAGSGNDRGSPHRIKESAQLRDCKKHSLNGILRLLFY